MLNSVEHLPGHLVARKAEPGELVVQQWFVVRKPHSIDVLDDERERSHLPECPVELLIQIVDAVVGTAPAALAIPLTRVAPREDVCLLELVDVANVSMLDRVLAHNLPVQMAGRLVDLIGPQGINTGRQQAKVAAPAAGKQRDGRILELAQVNS